MVKAADHLHSSLLEADNVRKVEPAALSLVTHMWALSDEVCIAQQTVNLHTTYIDNRGCTRYTTYTT